MQNLAAWLRRDREALVNQLATQAKNHHDQTMTDHGEGDEAEPYYYALRYLIDKMVTDLRVDDTRRKSSGA
eukprot:14701303-Alexandrium_andersonii.AAC.1